jgi:2-polyprenyl-3-methyl-5-hydroxy-6-metoxy-1,4-benzoquinol methylase
MSELNQDYGEKNIDYYGNARPELLQFIAGKVHSALDVGCGAGNFGAMLKEVYQCEVWGIEPEERSAAAAGNKLDRLLNIPFNKEALEKIDKKFDYIFFNDVLEHLVRPDEALLLATELLAEGGKIIASIPNIRFYPVMLQLIRYRDFKYLEAGVMDKTHLRFFTEKSMVRLFAENGLTVETIRGINKHDFRYLNLLNALLFNKLADMKFPQYGIVAVKKTVKGK